MRSRYTAYVRRDEAYLLRTWEASHRPSSVDLDDTVWLGLEVLATEGATARSSGELPWRTAFGTPLQLLRHQNNDVALAELARVYVRDAFRRWLPDAEVVRITVERDGAVLAPQIRFRAAGRADRSVRVPISAPP